MSLQRAINEKCRQCTHDPEHAAGSWRQQVALCMDARCPLWRYRPAPHRGLLARPPRTIAELRSLTDRPLDELKVDEERLAKIIAEIGDMEVDLSCLLEEPLFDLEGLDDVTAS